MADLYTFVSSVEVDLVQPPNNTIQVQQVTAQAIQSGIFYVDRFTKDQYSRAGEVATALNALAQAFDSWALINQGGGITTYTDTDSSGQLVDKTSVTVASTSGKSTTTFDWTYPVPDFETQSVQQFAVKVEAERAILDAVEAA